MIRIDDRDLRRAMNHLGRAFRAEGVSKDIKRSVSKRLRSILAPMVAERKARVLALPSQGKSKTSMRQAIARKISANTRWSGRNTGVSIVQRARGMPRDFQYAGRAFNRESGWHPQNLGGTVTTQRMEPTDWFDGASSTDYPMVRQEIIQALDEVAGKMANEIRRIR
jgi:hypothetical protein